MHDVQEVFCTCVHKKLNRLVPYFDISFKLGQSQGPVYVKLENEALRKLDPFSGENVTLYVNWVPTDQKIGRGGGFAGPVARGDERGVNPLLTTLKRLKPKGSADSLRSAVTADP